MKTKRIFRTAVTLLFALCVVAADLPPLSLAPQTASAVTQADIDKLKKESNALASKKSNVTKELNALKKDKANTLKRKSLLDQQIVLISDEIAVTEQQIAQYEALIEQTENELNEAQAQEAEQYQLFCKRVRAMEERGTVSYWSVLFQAASFEEMLGALDFISEVMEADQRVIDDLRVLQEQIAAKQATLEDSLAEQQSAKERLAAKNSELRDQRTEATSLIKEMEENGWDRGEDDEELFEFAMHETQYRDYKSGAAKKRFLADLQAARDKETASGMSLEEAAAFKHAKADAIVATESGTVLWEIGGDGECVKSIEPYIGKEYKEGDFFCYIENTHGQILELPAALGGKLVEINAKQGTHVQKGDVIAYIERKAE